MLYGMTQNYTYCDSNSIVQSVTMLQQCFAAIGKWMSANRLKLNGDKTELLWTGSRHSLRELSSNGPSLVLGADDIDVASVTRLLGVWITSDVFLGKHIYGQ